MILYGAGTHAKVIIDCLEASGHKVSFVFDDNDSIKKNGENKVISPYESSIQDRQELIISIGNNLIRKRISERVHHDIGKVIHPSALISHSVSIGKGSVVIHRAIIQASTEIGNFCIINTGAIVEHDCMIADFVHIAHGTVLCGGVKVGEGTLVGAGSTVIENVSIGKWCIIAAGSVIIKDIPDFSMVAGVPGKVIKNLATSV